MSTQIFGNWQKLQRRNRLQAESKGVGRSLEITAEGKSAHGATPEAGLSAVSIMMEFLGKLNFAGDDFNVFLDFYNKHIGFDVNGQRMGHAAFPTRSAEN